MNIHSLRRPAFFTHDDDFYQHNLCHAQYCLVYLAVRKDEAATFVRRFLRYREFNTQAKRMGTVLRVSHTGITGWRLHTAQMIRLDWYSRQCAL